MSTQRCTECRTILGSLVLAHTVDCCPLRKMRYCGICATYGHNHHNCPDPGAMTYREPLYIEQLVPASVAIEFNIQSKSPLMGIRSIAPATKPIMEVPENEEAIRAALVAAGEKPMICQQKGRAEKKELLENKKRLQKVADMYGRKLIFVKDSAKPLSEVVPLTKKK